MDRIDIEAALNWAFGVVRIDDRIGALARYGIEGRSVEAMRVLAEIGLPRGPRYRGAGEVLAGYAVLGISGGGSGGGAVLARPSAGAAEERDALAIHDAVLGLGDIWFEESEDGIVMWDAESIAEAGHRLHRRGAGRSGAVWLETCEGGWVQLSDPGILALVVHHARLGSRPSWGEDYGRVLQGRTTDGRFSRQTDADLWAQVVWHRTVYTVWHRALADIAARLDGQLVAMAVEGPVAEAQPWSCQAREVKQVKTASRLPIDKSLKQRDKKLA